MLVHKIVSLAFRFQVFFSVASTASLPTLALPPPSRSSLLAQPNSTLPVTLTILNLPLNNLPTDPSLYRLYESALVVKFYNYRIPINVKSTYGTLQTAIEDVIDHLWGDVHKGNIVMTPRAQGYSYRSGQVGLTLYTQHDMTWGMWGETLQGLREFGEFWEFVELQFDIIDGQVMRGSGQFRAL